MYDKQPIAGGDIQSFNECMAIPEIQRVKIISSISPKSISLFSQTALLSCLEYSDTEIHPLISYLWKLLPADLLIQRLLNSQNPSVFYSLPIKINILPEIKSCTSNVYKLLLILASPSLIPLILDLYLQQSQQEYLNKYKKDLSVQGTLEKSANLDNFRIIKYLLKEEGNNNISNCFLSIVQSVLSEYLAPPCISGKVLVYEIEELLDEIVYNDLYKLKDFVFGGIIAADIRGKIGELLKKKGINCREELELNRLKEKNLEKMPEELGLELLHTRNYEDADDVISRWRKEKIFKNLEYD